MLINGINQFSSKVSCVAIQEARMVCSAVQYSCTILAVYLIIVVISLCLEFSHSSGV